MDLFELFANANGAEDFETLADQLLNHCSLMIGSINPTPYRLLEIEFYLHNKNHPDPYVHCDLQQLTIFHWYFHRKGNSYKGGTFKGLDVSFAEDGYGGILIRAIQAPDGTVIEGPSLVVDHILHRCNFKSVAQFVASRDDSGADNPPLRITKAEQPIGDIYTCRRVGLGVRDEGYRQAPYRYMTSPHLIKKDRAGLKDGLSQIYGLTPEEIKALLKGPK